MIILLFFLLGMVAALLSSLFGIGGGIIMVPGLAAIFSHYGFAPRFIMPMASSTSMATVIFIASNALYYHHRQGNIQWKIVKQMAPALIVTSILGVLLAIHLSPQLIRIIFAVLLGVVALQLLKNKAMKHPLMQQHLSFVGCSFLGLIMGMVSGLTGIGGGIIATPIFLRLGLTMPQAAGTTTVCVWITGIIGAVSFILTGLNQPGAPQGTLGFLYWHAALVMIIASLIFVPIGIKIAKRLSTPVLKKGFAGLLILISVKMLLVSY